MSLELHNGHVARFGYTPHPARCERLHARCLAGGHRAMLERLTDAPDDNGDRYNYRPLVACLQLAGLKQWLVSDDDYLRLNTYDQGDTSSCHGQARSMQLAIEHAIGIVLGGAAEDFLAMPAPEVQAAFAEEIDGSLGTDSGASCSGEVEGSEQFGVGFALAIGSYDLTQSNAAGQDIKTWQQRLLQFVKNGCPAEVRAWAKQHISLSHVRVETPEEAWAATGHGYAILCGSNISFDGSRNEEGVILRTGNDWPHAMCVSSRRTSPNYGRLYLVHQSWAPDWTSGPYWLDQPAGSFWIVEKDLAAMLTCRWSRRSTVKDSWISTGNVGFVRRADKLPDWLPMAA
jgi:hypothetical protein